MPVVRTDGRAYGHVITKFSWMGSLPHFLTHGAPQARFARQSSAIKYSGLHLFVCKSIDFRSSLFKKPFFLITPKYHGPLVVILKGFHFSFQITVLDVDLHLICSACFAERNRGRCYPSNSHGFQLRKIGAGIYLSIYFIWNNIYSGMPSLARLV